MLLVSGMAAPDIYKEHDDLFLFNIFHVGAFQPAGTFTSRSTYKQRLAFKPDGSLASLNQVNVRWTRKAGYSYSLDLVLRDGTVVGPCIDVNSVNRALAWSYAGRCTSPGIDVAPSNISAFRVCSAVGGDWSRARCGTTAYDGKRMDASIVIP
ncbi:hypothetical protein BON30_19080 [Cystobacter ferrugineus]|uniref:Uncharacterized protein n=2 Tax=Cystobacter ferrugineus TaxID=83449 RepID=A0A1L9BBL8_9BACT|nr:hypothetical protein BON30_19080 [Cystobacter ferrugineus]